MSGAPGEGKDRGRSGPTSTGTGQGTGSAAVLERARAAILAEPGRIELRPLEVADPGPGEVRIRLEGSGVCASNLEPWAGRDWFDYPFAPGDPGHEGWGVVDAVGDGVTGLRAGERVASLGVGAYATHHVVAAADAVPLPEALDGRPFPGEPLACALNIFDRSGIGAGDRVAIVGIGFLGALLTQLAVAEGARVIGLSRRGFARGVGRDAGAEATESTEDPDAAVAAVEAWTDGGLCDVVVEATGKRAPLDLAARLTRVRGRLVVAGYHQDGARRVDMQLWNWRGLDVINAHERAPERYRAGLRRAVEATLAGRIEPWPLLTDSLPLERLGAALDRARDRPDGFLKAIVTT